ncbi:MAG: ATP-grasp domain-containing protein [Endozoicomonadaceae bacterium]|nr:ATP-grasp domain-containing protein [Endozoicomonadaceae bacterium]
MIKKLLVANRGEIACRIIRTAKKMGIKTVAVWSEADSNAMHKAMADENVYIGPAVSQHSYLNSKVIIDAAIRHQAEAIHPGYGFLSENASFATAVKQAGLLFIGAPIKAIRAMGDKASAKIMMEKEGVPVVPGFSEIDANTETLIKAAEKITYPILLKASAGGGGKGMRIVDNPQDFPEALAQARREAQSAFGNDHIILEKYLHKPRHVEVQIFFDQQGKGIYLFDRDCSLQRRYQKVIEEAPAPGLSEHLHKALGEMAVRAGKIVDYVGAGTVEFLLDHQHNFYFMEMNTRLQVEHPVTEMITGTDLVQWQIEIACGKPLPVSQAQLMIQGHAIETRLYAEQPAKNFIPVTGKINYLNWPADQDYLRVETGVRSTDEITPWYDPMIAKLVTWGEDRNSAIKRMQDALKATKIAGLPTNRDFLIRLINIPDFLSGDVNTSLIVDHINTLFSTNEEIITALIATSFYVYHQRNDFMKGWRLNLPETAHFLWAIDEKEYHVILLYLTNKWKIQINNNDYYCDHYSVDKTAVTLSLTAQTAKTFNIIAFDKYYTFFSDTTTLTLKKPLYITSEQKNSSCSAPMNGTIASIKTSIGSKVSEGDTLLTIEAMKMELSIKAPHSGIISALFFKAGDRVEEGATLFACEEK